jgi:hypothetical protein
MVGRAIGQELRGGVHHAAIERPSGPGRTGLGIVGRQGDRRRFGRVEPAEPPEVLRQRQPGWTIVGIVAQHLF